MEKVDVLANGRTEEIESQIRSLISSDMPIDEKNKQLDGVRIAAGEHDDSSWELCVTELTHEIRRGLDEIDGHVAPSIDGN